MRAVEALAVKLAQVRVRPHVRSVGGKLVPVMGYVRGDSTPTLPALGDCYSVALELTLHPPKGITNVKLVHATVQGAGPAKGIRFGHAWIEGDRKIGTHTVRVAIDKANGHDVELPRGYYRDLGQVSDVHEYTRQEMAREATSSGTYGPWHEDEVARD